MSKYQQVTKSNIANYQPTVAVLEVKKLPKMTDGFGSDYDGTYQIENIISLTTLEDFMIGNWVEPINHHPTAIQGFSLKKNGKSNSINMASLQYSGWKLNENKLILFGTSIGNHQTINFIDEYDIDIIDKNEIYLIQENNKRKFYRSASN